ncbi:MAG: peptidoglycan DD-metalloendopeptidase family protein [Gammaproteobacteria bacterium]|nr:peptidoglycan DD-metalloendopeptidase family protein [Gammaproteobacteria bacterium]
MNKTILTLISTTCLVFSFCGLSIALAANDNTSLQKINALQDKILLDNQKLSQLEQKILELDTNISEKAKGIEQLNQVIKKIVNAKLDLQYKKSQQFDILYFQKKQLNMQLKTTYVIHRNNNIQKLGNITNIQQLHRLLNYLESVNNSSVIQIQNIRNSLAELDKLDNNLDLLNQKQQQYKYKISQSYNALKELKESNLKFKQNLVSSINKDKAKLSFYEETYNSLNKSLSNQNNVDTKDTISTSKFNKNSLFTRAKGNLALPVEGMIDDASATDNTRKAIFIKSPEGQKVRSVFDGQVVFSNWLRGFGFLTIVNHKDGFMSLYGHNQTLLKKTGDKVKTGEILALTGASGSTQEPGLYFELRHNGNTLNPLAWLKIESSRSIG